MNIYEASRLHAGRCVDCVAEETVARHLSAHDASHRGSRVDSWNSIVPNAFYNFLLIMPFNFYVIFTSSYLDGGASSSDELLNFIAET